jgi:peptide/nickel transport system permease protein
VLCYISMRNLLVSIMKIFGMIILLALILTAPSLFVSQDGEREINLLGPVIALQDFFSEITSENFLIVKFGETPGNLLNYIPNYFYASFLYLAAGSIASILLGLLLGIIFGLRSSRIRQGILVFLGAIPNFIMVLTLQLLSVFFYQHFHFRLGLINYAYSSGRMVMPFLTILLVTLSFSTRISSRYTIQTISEEYIRYAKSKGLSRKRLIIGHILPSVIHSMRGSLLKIISLSLGTLFIIERMFNMPGLTRLLFQFGFSLEYNSYWGIHVYTANLRIAITVVIILSLAIFITYLIALLLLHIIRKAADYAI